MFSGKIKRSIISMTILVSAGLCVGLAFGGGAFAQWGNPWGDAPGQILHLTSESKLSIGGRAFFYKATRLESDAGETK